MQRDWQRNRIFFAILVIHGSSGNICSRNGSEFVAVLEAIPSRKELAVCSTRTKEAKESAKVLLELCRKEENMEVLAGFCARLNAEIKSIIGPRMRSKDRRRMWTKFSVLRTEKLPSMWKGFLRSVGLHCGDLLFMELMNDALLDKSLHVFCKSQPSTSSEQAGMMDEHDAREEMTLDEQMIVRYACGYVGMKIRKRFLRQRGEKAARFVECIDQMHAC